MASLGLHTSKPPKLQGHQQHARCRLSAVWHLPPPIHSHEPLPQRSGVPGRRRLWNCTRAVAEETSALSLQHAKAETLKAWVQGALHEGLQGDRAAAAALPDLIPKADQDGGFMMVTSEPVGEGQVLVRVPRRLMLTWDTTRNDPEYGRLVEEGPLTEWQAMVLGLLCERARGLDSFWAPYLAMLPEQADHPLTWGEDRISWLTGSPMQATLRSRQQQVLDDCEVLQVLGANDLPLARRWADSHQGELLVCQASVTWAAATLLSRAFSLDLSGAADVEDEDEMDEGAPPSGSWSPGSSAPQADSLCLVPWADSLNHSSAAGQESCLRYEPELQAASLSAHTAYLPGQQVFDSYGPNLSPCDLLLDYGYNDPTNTNHQVEVDLTRIAPPSSKQAKTLLGAMAKLHTGGASTDNETVLQPVTAAGPDVTLLTWVRAALSTDAALIRAGWRVKSTANDIEQACRVMGRLAEPASQEAEKLVLLTVQSHFSALLAAYPPPATEEANQGTVGATTDRVEQAARSALASERTALQGAMEAVAGWLEQLGAGCPLDELYGWGDEEEEEFDESEQAS